MLSQEGRNYNHFASSAVPATCETTLHHLPSQRKWTTLSSAVSFLFHHYPPPPPPHHQPSRLLPPRRRCSITLSSAFFSRRLLFPSRRHLIPALLPNFAPSGDKVKRRRPPTGRYTGPLDQNGKSPAWWGLRSWGGGFPPAACATGRQRSVQTERGATTQRPRGVGHGDSGCHPPT